MYVKLIYNWFHFNSKLFFFLNEALLGKLIELQCSRFRLWRTTLVDENSVATRHHFRQTRWHALRVSKPSSWNIAGAVPIFVSVVMRGRLIVLVLIWKLRVYIHHKNRLISNRSDCIRNKFCIRGSVFQSVEPRFTTVSNASGSPVPLLTLISGGFSIEPGFDSSSRYLA